MLNARYLENTISTHPALVGALWGVKDENEVRRVVPILQPVATIHDGGTGPYRGKVRAYIYPLPSGELVRIRVAGDFTFDYNNAALVPEMHPVHAAHQQYPDKHIDIYPVLKLEDDRPPNKEHPAYLEYAKNNVRIVILASEDKEQGERLNKNDRAWLKKTIEAQAERCRVDVAVQDLKP